MTRKKSKRMRYRSYRYKLDQLSDILGIGRIEKISMLRRNHGVPSAPKRGAMSGATYEALEHSTIETSGTKRTKTILSRRFLAVRQSRTWRSLVGHWHSKEGLIGKWQLDRWTKILAEHGLQAEWSQEKPESATCQSVRLGVTAPSDSRLWSRMFHHHCQLE